MAKCMVDACDVKIDNAPYYEPDSRNMTNHLLTHIAEALNGLWALSMGAPTPVRVVKVGGSATGGNPEASLLGYPTTLWLSIIAAAEKAGIPLAELDAYISVSATPYRSTAPPEPQKAEQRENFSPVLESVPAATPPETAPVVTGGVRILRPIQKVTS